MHISLTIQHNFSVSQRKLWRRALLKLYLWLLHIVGIRFPFDQNFRNFRNGCTEIREFDDFQNANHSSKNSRNSGNKLFPVHQLTGLFSEKVKNAVPWDSVNFREFNWLAQRFIKKISPVVNESIYIHCVILLQGKLQSDCCLESLKNLFISFICYCLLALGKCLAQIFVVIKLRTSLIWPPNCL